MKSPMNVEHAEYITRVQQRKSSLLDFSSPDAPSDIYTRFLRRSDNDVTLFKNIYEYVNDEFTDEAFRLPDEEVIDKRAHERERAHKIVQTKKLNQQRRQERCMHALTALDRITDDQKKKSDASSASSLHKQPIQARRKQRVHDSITRGKAELEVVRAALTQPNTIRNSASNISLSSTKLPSTIDHPKVGSIEEMSEDLRQAELERWCFKHGKTPATKLLNNEKQVLRKWFKEIDERGDGEVTANELQNALLSSGLFKTREQVIRILSNMDKNSLSDGAGFEDFLQAFYISAHISHDDTQSNKHHHRSYDTGMPKKKDKPSSQHQKLKRLQAMCANPLGFSMNTLLTEERRIKFLRSIFHTTSDDSSSKAINQRKLHDRFIDALEAVVLDCDAQRHHPHANDRLHKLKNYKFRCVEDEEHISSLNALVNRLHLPPISGSQVHHSKAGHTSYDMMSTISNKNPYAVYAPLQTSS